MSASLASLSSLRTHYCGDVGVGDVGQTVTVCGWVARRREHGEHLAFIDLRDRSGILQCVVDNTVDIRSEWVVQITGTVRERPEGTVNANLATGAVEVGECTVVVLAEAEPPPFPVDERADAVDETIRLRHRYLDLRRDRMQNNLRVRSAATSAIRRAMEDQGFLEVETPLLIASTPEGARDFVVPSRLKRGSFYALPQSPQLFKQLCMVGGIDRYFQIAKCLRDEDLRADRQFEFTQLDAEMSFATQEDVQKAIGAAVGAAIRSVTGEEPPEIERMTWHDAMNRYGSDKPDVRFGLELIDVTAVFAATGFNAFKADTVRALRVEGGADTTRSRLDDLTDKARQWGAKGLVWMRVTSKDGALGVDSPVAKFLSADEIADLLAATDAADGDLLLLVADRWAKACHVLGLLRLELGRPPVTALGLRLLWVVDFPLFEEIDEATGRPTSAHHPFTMPHPDDVALIDRALQDGATEELLTVRSQSYDLVLNGWELGSGSVRISTPDMQKKVFALLGIGEEEESAKFGFLLDAFRFGAPPHAGFAFGVDRLVAILAGEDNIREVIAFPKTQTGTDPLTNSPLPLDAAHLDELGLRVLPPPT